MSDLDAGREAWGATSGPERGETNRLELILIERKQVMVQILVDGLLG